MAGALGLTATRIIADGHAHLFDMPAVGIARNHAARRLKAFAHRTAAFLRFAQAAAELVGHEK